MAQGAAARVLDVSSDAPDVPRSARARVVVLLSGTGTLCAALLDAAAEPDAGFEVVAVGADRADAAGLAHAHRRGVPTFVSRCATTPTGRPGTPRWPPSSPPAVPTGWSAPGS